MWCVSRFGTICAILKNVKNTHKGVLILVELQASACNFTKIKTPPWVFFIFFKSYKWYQIAQRITNGLAKKAVQNYFELIFFFFLGKLIEEFSFLYYID